MSARMNLFRRQLRGWTPQTPWGALLHARGLMELIGRKISVCDAAENLSVFRLQEAFHPINRRHFVQIRISAAGVNSAGDYPGDGAGLPAHFLCRCAADASGCPLREPCHPRHRKRGDQERSDWWGRAQRDVPGGEQPTLGGNTTL